ncbi:MAG: DNA alkylation repair protein [Fidelibacterota bacterium]
MYHQEITRHFIQLSNPDIALHSQRFFKTGKNEYGEGDLFLGIRVPVVRKAVKKFKLAPIKAIEELLHSEYHEIRLFSLLWLVDRFNKATPDDQENIYHLYIKNMPYINNWDLVDSSAHHIVGAYLENKDKTLLDDCSKSDSLWSRRIAIMATFYYIKRNHFTDALHISETLLNDPEDLIHKAVGWMLREIGKRDLKIETEFLKSHYKQMPRTMLRYAIEKFNFEERHKYLNGNI